MFSKKPVAPPFNQQKSNSPAKKGFLVDDDDEDEEPAFKPQPKPVIQ